MKEMLACLLILMLSCLSAIIDHHAGNRAIRQADFLNEHFETSSFT